MNNLPILLFLVAAASGGSIHKESETLKFDVIASRSIEEPPTIGVKFANGVKDAFDLKHYRMNEESVVACNYLGRLRNNPSSSVAVTGCLNKPGDRIEVTLISEHNINKMFSVDSNGNAEIIKNPFEEGALSRALPSFNLDRSGYDDQKGDEIEDDEEEKFSAASAVTTIPSKLQATIRFGYTDGLKDSLDGEDFDAWIANVFTHTQAHFRHSASLGTTIEFDVVGSGVQKSGVTWTADDNIYDARDATNEGNYGVDTMSWWCLPGGGNVAGIAFVGALCSTYNTNLNEKQSTASGSGFVLAHELGHNFGMSHDFDESHGGYGGPCDGTGIMSYGSYDYDQWSTCSKSDWEHHYSSLNWGNGCLEDISGDSGTDEDESTDAPTEAPTEAPPSSDCANVDPDPNCDYWAGQGYCTETYVYYMEQNCYKSCGYCNDESEEPEEPEEPEGDCTPAGSLANCDNCLTGDQCAVGFCCPYMKKCVETSQTMCYLPIADCRSMCYDSYDPYDCNCENDDFPDNWAKPTC